MSLTDFIEYWIHLTVYEVLAILFIAPYVAPAIGLVMLCEYMKTGLLVAQIIAAPFMLAWIFIPPYIAHEAAIRQAESHSGFYESFRIVWDELKADLSFLPVVGRLFSSGQEDGHS